MRHTHLGLNLTEEAQIGAIGLGLLTERQHNTYSCSLQQPFTHTVNKQEDKHNTQWLKTGVAGTTRQR